MKTNQTNSSAPITSSRELFRLCEHEAIEIPRALRKRPVTVLEPSVRLRNALWTANITTLGHLRDRTYGQLKKLRNMGTRPTVELKGALCRYFKFIGIPADSTAHAFQLQRGPTSVSVPRQLHHYQLDELPLSTRVKNVLNKSGFTTLGELDKINLFRLWGMGFGSIKELAALIVRLGNGEFACPPARNFASRLLDACRCIDAAMARLTTRNREILIARMTGPDGHQPTLQSIGQQHGLTREAVRQAIAAAIRALRREGHCITVACEQTATICRKYEEPLTPRIFVEWTDTRIATLARPPEFYARLLDTMIRQRDNKPHAPATATPDDKKRIQT